MTEKETLQRAKMYMDKMANGVNPLTDAYVKDDDMINNVRISRCLFYVSKVLEQVIENGGVKQNTIKKRSSARFFITETQQKNLKINSSSIYVKDIAEEINRVTEENETRKIQAAWINKWLISIGMFEIIDEKKHATAQGEELGITTTLKKSEKYGDYYVNLFSSSAQAFIFDNIDSILAFHYNKDNSDTQEEEQ